ncbi:MAG: polysaccharide pyruvyl transferase family protein [Lachnospiraceae bacterium]|nr:polysaccharide pyruvyl transferase family protein [Lachnospiraceae bacterium]
MRAGVITFHSAHNYGATLQTWALQKAIAKLGAEPCVVNYHPAVIDNLYAVPKLNTRAKRWRYLKKRSERKRRKQLKLRFARYSAFLQNNLRLEGDYRTCEELAANPPGLDCYIAGSDQIWNPDHTGGFDPAYFLGFAEKGARKIAYAVSIGRDHFPAQYRDVFGAAIREFDAVSVREPSAADAVSEAFGSRVPVVLDPTLLLRREEYDEIKVPTKRKEKYILVYMMENNRRLVRLANSISVVTGLPVIQRKPGKIFHSELTPFFTEHPGEFLGELAGAEYVLTNSFHGTVFSLIYEKPFLSLLHSQTGSRISDLLEELGLTGHLLRDGKDFHDMGQFFLEDAAGLRRRIETMRADSIRFLEDALRQGQKED